MVTSLTVTFSRPVEIAGLVAGAFALTRDADGAAVAFTASASLVNGVTVVTLSGFTGPAAESGSLADGTYTLTVRAGLVTNGKPLDGNGDGAGGDDYVFGGAGGLYRLFGDATGDRRVDAADLALFRPAFGRRSGQPGYLAYFDADADGDVDALDLFRFRQRFGTTLP
jgi:hypothetical protein